MGDNAPLQPDILVVGGDIRRTGFLIDMVGETCPPNFDLARIVTAATLDSFRRIWASWQGPITAVVIDVSTDDLPLATAIAVLTSRSDLFPAIIAIADLNAARYVGAVPVPPTWKVISDQTVIMVGDVLAQVVEAPVVTSDSSANLGHALL